MNRREREATLTISRGSGSVEDEHIRMTIGVDDLEVVLRLDLTLSEFAQAITGRVLDRLRLDWHEKPSDEQQVAVSKIMFRALKQFMDDDPCQFDHDGLCQTHMNALDDGTCAMRAAHNLVQKYDQELG